MPSKVLRLQVGVVKADPPKLVETHMQRYTFSEFMIGASSVPTLIEQFQLVVDAVIGFGDLLLRKQLIYGHSLEHGEAQDL